MATQTPARPANSRQKKKDESSGASSEQVLKISTLAPKRPYVVIDDVQHQFRLMQEFGEREHQEFTRDTEQYDTLWQLEKPTDEQVKHRQELLEKLFDQGLIDAEKVREQLGPERNEDGRVMGLTGAIKREIVLAFTNAPSLMQMQEAMAREEAKRKELEDELSALTS